MKSKHLMALLVVISLYLIIEFTMPGYGLCSLILSGLAVVIVIMANVMTIPTSPISSEKVGRGEDLNQLPLDELIKRAGPTKAKTREGYDDVSIGIIPVFVDTANGETYVLIAQSKMLTPTGKNPWGFAKGHVDSGENEKEAAVRENREELGLDIDSSLLSDEITMEDNLMIDEPKLRKHLIKMIERGEEPHINQVGQMKRLIAFFVARLPEKSEPKPDVSEILDARWVSLEEAENMMKESDSNQLQILESLKTRV